MSFVNILGVVIAAIGATELVSLMRRAGEIARLAREELEDLDHLPVIDGWFAVSGDLPVALTARSRAGDRLALADDATAPGALLLWCLALSCIALGVIQMSLPAVGVAALGLVLLARGRFRDTRFRRHAVVVSARSQSVSGPTYGDSGIALVDLEGYERPLTVTVPWRLCRSLVDRHGSVDLLVAFEPMHPARAAYAIGARAPTGAAVESTTVGAVAPVRRARRETQ